MSDTLVQLLLGGALAAIAAVWGVLSHRIRTLEKRLDAQADEHARQIKENAELAAELAAERAENAVLRYKLYGEEPDDDPPDRNLYRRKTDRQPVRPRRERSEEEGARHG